MNPSPIINDSLEDLTVLLKQRLDEIRGMQAGFIKLPGLFPNLGEFLLRPLKEAKAWAEQNLKPGAPKPPPIIGELIKRWEDGDRNFELREINQLCWHPPTGTDTEFWDFLASKELTFTARRLQGLVYSYHSRFKDLSSVLQGVLGRALRDSLEDYEGSIRAVTTWRAHLDLLIGTDAPRRLGIEIFQNLQAIEEKTAALLISGTTSFVKEAVAVALEIALAAWPQLTQDQRTYLYERLLPQSDIDTKRRAVGRLIIKASQPAEDQLVGELKNYVLSEKDLGDPRLPKNGPNWIGFDEARGIFIQWLSREDITFFFQLVIADAQDVQRRKAFWLNYVGLIKRSWVILQDTDYYNMLSVQKKLQKNLGDAVGRFYWAGSSAFVMDFGSIVVVEFSKPGNAAYVYHSKEASDFINFYQKSMNSHSNLKNSEKTCNCMIAGQSNNGRIIHRSEWEYGARRMLAYHGIRRS